jgi:hypothetical protein
MGFDPLILAALCGPFFLLSEQAMNIQKVVTDDMTDTRTLQIKIEVRERQLASLSGDEREVEAAMLRIERDQLEETRACSQYRR